MQAFSVIAKILIKCFIDQAVNLYATVFNPLYFPLKRQHHGHNAR